jgi:hypothetical protein
VLASIAPGRLLQAVEFQVGRSACSRSAFASEAVGRCQITRRRFTSIKLTETRQIRPYKGCILTKSGEVRPFPTLWQLRQV